MKRLTKPLAMALLAAGVIAATGMPAYADDSEGGDQPQIVETQTVLTSPDSSDTPEGSQDSVASDVPDDAEAPEESGGPVVQAVPTYSSSICDDGVAPGNGQELSERRAKDLVRNAPLVGATIVQVYETYASIASKRPKIGAQAGVDTGKSGQPVYTDACASFAVGLPLTGIEVKLIGVYNSVRVARNFQGVNGTRCTGELIGQFDNDAILDAPNNYYCQRPVA